MDLFILFVILWSTHNNFIALWFYLHRHGVEYHLKFHRKLSIVLEKHDEFTYIHMLTPYFCSGRQTPNISVCHDPGTALSPHSNSYIISGILFDFGSFNSFFKCHKYQVNLFLQHPSTVPLTSVLL